ncbi:MAG: type I methionyl aminopeptidase [Planctomycetota bacterium]|jgi:methionyl aminopeptidase
MSITLRSRREIEMLRNAGLVVANVLSKLKKHAKPGVSTADLDDIAMEMTRQAGAVALFKGVPCPYMNKPFPGGICASINEQLVHGIPSRAAVLKDGDILTVDFGAKLNGYCELLDVTNRLLDIAIEHMAPGIKWSTIAAMMEQTATQAGFSIVKDYVGHGIGTEMHEDPKVPNFVSRELIRDDIVLKKGMILAVEPMVNMGKAGVRTLSDGWTVVTKDKKCSAHVEHTIALVENGCEVLTALS